MLRNNIRKLHDSWTDWNNSKMKYSLAKLLICVICFCSGEKRAAEGDKAGNKQPELYANVAMIQCQPVHSQWKRGKEHGPPSTKTASLFVTRGPSAPKRCALNMHEHWLKTLAAGLTSLLLSRRRPTRMKFAELVPPPCHSGHLEQWIFKV